MQPEVGSDVSLEGEMMPGRATYPATQIAACRAEMAAMTAAWRAVAARSQAKARSEVEAQVFNQMAVALEGWFVQPLRGVEGCHGTAMNEVRLLALGVRVNGGYFPSDHSILWQSAASVTGYGAGDRISLSEPVFSRLAVAYLDAVAVTFADA